MEAGGAHLQVTVFRAAPESRRNGGAMQEMETREKGGATARAGTEEQQRPQRRVDEQE